MKIICWNVNGLRAVAKKGAFVQLLREDPDIICLQETKSTPEQLPMEVLNPPRFFSFFSWPKEKKGYSGVAIYSKIKPESVIEGLGVPSLDAEGRILTAHYKKFSLITVYFPNGGGGPERLEYKLKFYDAFLKYVEKLRKTGKNIIFCGDVNTAHAEIDLARPKENVMNTGFLPVERAWIDRVIKRGYIDMFRYFNPDAIGEYTYWDMKTFSRERNVGWRIDYFFVNSEFVKNVKASHIHKDIFGSDHCPISIEI